jgi:hypothetical protein
MLENPLEELLQFSIHDRRDEAHLQRPGAIFDELQLRGVGRPRGQSLDAHELVAYAQQLGHLRVEQSIGLGGDDGALGFHGGMLW